MREKWRKIQKAMSEPWREILKAMREQGEKSFMTRDEQNFVK